MPIISIEYSASLEQSLELDKLLYAIHQLTIDSGLFAAVDVKSRLFKAEQWLVGDVSVHDDLENDKNKAAFIHVTLDMLEGRSDDQKNRLAQAIMDKLQAFASNVQSLSINLRDMRKADLLKNT